MALRLSPMWAWTWDSNGLVGLGVVSSIKEEPRIPKEGRGLYPDSRILRKRYRYEIESGVQAGRQAIVGSDIESAIYTFALI